MNGEMLRESGLALIEQSNGDWLSDMRVLAENHAMIHGTVTMDDIRDLADELSTSPTSPNAYGQVFRDSRFEWTGKLTRSHKPSNHARDLRVWTLRPLGRNHQFHLDF